MYSFVALYIKELKANKSLFLFLLALIAGLGIYGLLSLQEVPPGNIIDDNMPSGVILPVLSTFVFLASMPFLLAHMFNSEWKSETHYQMLAIPVHQFTVILAKVAGVATLGIVGGGLVTGITYFCFIRVAELMGRVAPVSFADYSFVAGFWVLAYMVFMFGLVVGMEGVKYSVKQYRGLTAVAFLIGVMYLFGKLAEQVTDALSFLGTFSIEVFSGDATITYSGFDVANFVYAILFGLMLMVVGLVVYEKRAEI